MIKIFLRNTENWNTVTYDKLWHYNNYHRCHEKTPFWDKWYSMTWFQYRHKVKQISLSNWKFPCVHSIKEIEEDDIILPSDDDDWFHPIIEDFLTDNMRDNDVLWWPHVVNKSLFNYKVFRYCHPYICGSNSYAFRGSVINKVSSGWRLALDHSHVLKLCEESSLKVAKAKIALSVYNKHCGSAGSFAQISDPLDVIKMVPKGKPRELPSKFHWMEPYYSNFLSLVESLHKHVPTLL